MGNGTVVTTTGRKIMLNRGFKSAPDYLHPSQFKTGTGTTTPVIANTAMETAVDITAGVQLKDVLVGYPSLDETNNQSTTRCVLLTTDANGNTLTEFGLFNKDATPKMFSHAVFTGIAKTTSVQIIIIEKDKIT
jgi:hypothetical protein